MSSSSTLESEMIERERRESGGVKDNVERGRRREREREFRGQWI